MGVALVMGCSGTPAENRSKARSVFTLTWPLREGSVYVFTYNGQEFMVASNGYKGGISLIQINK